MDTLGLSVSHQCASSDRSWDWAGTRSSSGGLRGVPSPPVSQKRSLRLGRREKIYLRSSCLMSRGNLFRNYRTCTRARARNDSPKLSHIGVPEEQVPKHQEQRRVGEGFHSTFPPSPPA